MSSKITPEHQSRTAIVYVRQSTSFKIVHNQESQRRQYGLVDYARQLGFGAVDVIDEDLGRTGSGLVERPGFQRLVVLSRDGLINFQHHLIAGIAFDFDEAIDIVNGQDALAGILREGKFLRDVLLKFLGASWRLGTSKH